jgi:serine/threonine-protein kinase
MKQNYVISIPVKAFWRIAVPAAVLGGLVCMLVGILVVDNLVMPRIVHVNRGWVTVPVLRAVPYEQARQRLYDVGLRLSVRGREYNDSVAEQCVISQEPPAGERLNTAERRGVNVVMSKGPEVARVPQVVGGFEYQAKRELRKQGFEVGGAIHRYDPKVPKDHVISVSPPAGTRISREMPVSMTVSKGPEPTEAAVPNLVGEMLSDAKKLLEENELTTGDVTYRYSATSMPGRVLSQSSPPGASIPLHSAVNLVVCAEKHE